MFFVGQKVVCIHDYSNWPSGEKCGMGKPALNGVYTVREITQCAYTFRHGIRLREIINPLHPDGTEYGYDNRFFRPLIATKQEISFTVGADPLTEQFDNRKKHKGPVR